MRVVLQPVQRAHIRLPLVLDLLCGHTVHFYGLGDVDEACVLLRLHLSIQLHQESPSDLQQDKECQRKAFSQAV